MKNNLLVALGLFFACFSFVACETSQDKIVCDLAKNFSKAYYNYDTQAAKQYCVADLYSMMKTHHENLTNGDWILVKKLGNVSVRVIDYKLDLYCDEATVYMEISNFLRINYLADSLNFIPCDTVKLNIVRGKERKWLVRNPIQGVNSPWRKYSDKTELEAKRLNLWDELKRALLE